MKAIILSGDAHWLLKAIVLKESHIYSSLPELPYKRKIKFILNPLPTYLCTWCAFTCMCVHAHTHFSSFTWTRNNTVLIRKDRLTLAKDWNGKSICECLTIPVPPLTSSKSWDRFAFTVTFYVPGVCLLDILGLLLAGLKITKSCSHLILRKGISKYKLLRSPQKPQLTYRNPRSVRKTVKTRHRGQGKHCLGIVNHAKEFSC